MKKRIITAILIMLIMTALFTFSVQAEDYIEAWDVSATENDSVMAYLYSNTEKAGYYRLVISGTGDIAGETTDYELPWTAPAYSGSISSITVEQGVTSIGIGAFYSIGKVDSVSLADGIKEIGPYAFFNTGVGEITLPKSLEKIGENAFYATNLTSIFIPEGVKEIGEGVFGYCDSLTTIEVDEKNQYYKATDNCLYSKDGTVLLKYIRPKKSNIAIIPKGVTTVGSYAFSTVRTQIYAVFVPKSVTVLKDDLMSGNSEMKLYAQAPSKPSGWDIYDSIAQGALWGVGELGVLENGLVWVESASKEIVIAGFLDTSNTTVVPETVNGLPVTTLGKDSFTANDTMTVILPSTITSAKNTGLRIRGMAIYSTAKSQPVDWDIIPLEGYGSVTWGCLATGQLENGVYWVQNGNNEIIIAGYESTEENASVVIPSCVNGVPVTSIGIGAFNMAKSLVKIEIPSSVTAIGSFSFSGSSLVSLTVPEGVTSIGRSAFSSITSLLSVELPSTLEEMGDSIFNSCYNLTSAVIRGEITYIAKDTFNLCYELKTVVFPETVTQICERAFAYCHTLTDVTVPKGLTYIGASAFDSCQSIKSIYIPSSVTTVGRGAFYNCPSLFIRCEAKSKPSTWDSNWNISVCKVFWGDCGNHDFDVIVTPPTCETDGYTENVCKNCGYSFIDNRTQRLGHSYVTEVVPPTCISSGYTMLTCKNCNDQKKTSISFEKIHQYEETDIPSTCTTQGYTEYLCKLCGKKYKGNYKDVLPHSYEITVTPPTCIKGGYSTYVCTACGERHTADSTDIIPHSYSEEVIPSTCIKKGYTVYTCTSCGDTYKDNTTDLLPHSYSFAGVTEPTCASKGYTSYKCDMCGTTKRDNYVQALPHQLEEISRTEPTCTTDGSSTQRCSVCKRQATVTLEAKGHTFESTIVPPTCTTDGYTLNVCTDCSTSEKTDVVQTTGHSYTLISEDPPFCNVPGSATYSCDICGATKSQYLSPLDHDYKATETIEPTCEAVGYTNYLCQRCGKVIALDLVPGTGHQSNLVSVVEPTCTEQGYTLMHCDKCGQDYKIDPVSAYGHTPVFISTKEPTCSYYGYTEYRCTVCEEVYRDDIVNRLPHNEQRVVIEPTCTASGKTVITCTNCTYELETNFIRPLGHDNKMTYDLSPTCTESGYTVLECQRCGFTDKTNYRPALGHVANTQTVVSPTCTEKGYTAYFCTMCQQEVKESFTAALGHTYENEKCIRCGVRECVAYWDVSKNGDGSVIAYLFDDEEKEGFYILSVIGTGEMKDWNGTPYLPYYSYARKISSVTVEDGVTNVGSYAFAGLYAMTSVTLSRDVTSIGARAFDACFELTTVLIHSGVELMGDRVFSGGTDLTVNCEAFSKPEGWSNSWMGSSSTTVVWAYGHTHSYEETVIPPTCTSQGYTKYLCACGDNYKDNYVSKTPHVYEESVSLPTCTEQGYTTYSCINCTYVRRDNYVSKLPHQYEIIEAKDSNCIEFGYTVQACTVCGDVKRTDFHRYGNHGYEAKETVAPTCTKMGYTVYICIFCGSTTKDDYVGRTEHSYEAVKTVEPTCTEQGYTVYSCKECADTYNGSFTEVVEHNYKISKTTRPTCTDKGIDVFSCTYCGDWYEVFSVPFGHKYVDGVCTRCQKKQIVSWDCSAQGDGSMVATIKESPFGDNTHILIISGKGTMADYNSPSSAPWFLDGYNIVSLIIEEGVETVGSFAFGGMKGLKNVSLPSTIILINEYAFAYSSEICCIIIPASTLFIYNNAFTHCERLVAYCEAEEKPSGWIPDWDASVDKVVWGFEHQCVSQMIYDNGNGTHTVVCEYNCVTVKSHAWTEWERPAPDHAFTRSCIECWAEEQLCFDVEDGLASVKPESVERNEDDSVKIDVSLGNEELNGVKIEISSDILSQIKGAETEINTNIGSIILDAIASEKVSQILGDVSIGISNVTEEKEAKTGQIVFSIVINDGEGNPILPPDSSDNGTVILSFTYYKGLDRDEIKIAYRDENGNLKEMEIESYDPETGEICFKTPHLSDYVIYTEYDLSEKSLNQSVIFKGYSFGPQNGQMCIGYSFDRYAIENYEKITGNMLQVGVVLSLVEPLNGSLPLDKSANAASDCVQVVDLTLATESSEYDLIATDLVLSGPDEKLIGAAYIYDSQGVSYIQSEGISQSVTAVTYNEAKSEQ